VELINKLGATVFKPNIDVVFWGEKEGTKFPLYFPDAVMIYCS
jgi:hypothetical protein